MEKAWKVLIPVDFSRYSLETVEFALSLPLFLKPAYTFFHVVTVGEMEPAGRREDNLTQRVKDATAELESLAERSRQDHSGALINCRVTSGVPFKEICLLADEEKFRLIVIGTHGRTGLSHLMIGSTAERVVQLASCPVLSLKPRII
ncbi:MAG TPA: universal stress protein [Desulfuromonadales bacterium]|nr:universal stress protein [Desulfuromonadales bacterium]